MNCLDQGFFAKNAASRIALLGPPGAGKTTVGKRLAAHLKITFIDADDDILQPAWGQTVAEELACIGPKAFIEKEGLTCLKYILPHSYVLSMTGSNPLHDGFMKHMSSQALLVYLDVHQDDILGRLERMKVDRIVCQKCDQTISAVLQYRQEFYERCYHLRVLCGLGDDENTVFGRVLDALRASRGHLVSSRGVCQSVTFGTAMRTGLAPDGGLYTPQEVPTFDSDQWKRLVPLSFIQRCFRVLEPWIPHTDLPPSVLRQGITAAYDSQHWSDPEICPVRHLEGRMFVQELFHGPTGSFKDLSISLMAECLARISSKPQLILVATSGDTGSAVLSAFSRQGWPVVVLYPQYGVSAVQHLCMTQFDDETAGRLVCGLDADFDACQKLVKTTFSQWTDSDALNGANSINWGRLLPQVAFHCSSYLELVKQGYLHFGESLNLAIPTGNFGDALAAFYAKLMGLPLGKILCVNNENDTLTEFLRTGCLDLRNRKLVRTISPAIDILRPSNLERLISHFVTGAVKDLYASLDTTGRMQVSPKTLLAIQEHFVGASVGHEETLTCIRDIYHRCGYVMDPHTAVATAGRRVLDCDSSPLLVTATAHPAKFAETVVKALTGEDSDRNPHTSISRVNDMSKGHPAPHELLGKLPKRDGGRKCSVKEVKDLIESMLRRMT